MGGKLDSEARVTIGELRRRGLSLRSIARTLDVTEGSVRYHLKRQAEGVQDGRRRQPFLAESYEEAILVWLEQRDLKVPRNLAALHDYLVEEHGYPGSLRSLQRYARVRWPKPRRRARRRVETVPGAQAQADWGEFRGVVVGRRAVDLSAFHMQLSFSRFDVVIWSLSKDQLAWHHVHNESFRRLEGVPATVRIDNPKTAVARGAGPWGTFNRSYRRYARSVRFHIDLCLPRSPEHKGKVERRIRDQRAWFDPHQRSWRSLEELQETCDREMLASARRRTCPATGTTAWRAWQREKPHLGELPILPEPFDVAVTRTVARDCTVAFEGRMYSVPFRWLGRPVEVRGCSHRVQVLADGDVVADHPRHTPERILIDPAHYDGPSTDRVIAPMPLGRMGLRLSEIWAMKPEQRPMDLYAALAEVAR